MCEPHYNAGRWGQHWRNPRKTNESSAANPAWKISLRTAHSTQYMQMTPVPTIAKEKKLCTMKLLAQHYEIFSSRYHQTRLLWHSCLYRLTWWHGCSCRETQLPFFCYACEITLHGPHCLARALSANPTRLFILYTGMAKYKSLHLKTAAVTDQSSLLLGPTPEKTKRKSIVIL